VNCSTNIVVDATSAAGAVVTYTSSASDACALASLNCTPPSGSTFPSGITTVICTAIDNAGNSNSCTFTITVRQNGGLRTQKRQVLADLIALRATVTDHSDQDDLDDTIDHIEDSLADSLWLDENHLVVKKGKKVFDEERDAAKELDELLDDAEDGDTTIP